MCVELMGGNFHVFGGRNTTFAGGAGRPPPRSLQMDVQKNNLLGGDVQNVHRSPDYNTQNRDWILSLNGG